MYVKLFLLHNLVGTAVVERWQCSCKLRKSPFYSTRYFHVTVKFHQYLDPAGTLNQVFAQWVRWPSTFCCVYIVVSGLVVSFLLGLYCCKCVNLCSPTWNQPWPRR